MVSVCMQGLGLGLGALRSLMREAIRCHQRQSGSASQLVSREVEMVRGNQDHQWQSSPTSPWASMQSACNQSSPASPWASMQRSALADGKRLSPLH